MPSRRTPRPAWAAALALLCGCSSETTNEGEEIRVTTEPVVAQLGDCLLLGVPSGMSFHYRAEDVRLLDVRLGEFAVREPGAESLRLLGEPMFELHRGQPGPAFSLVHPEASRAARTEAALLEGTRPLSANLLDTWIRSTAAPKWNPFIKPAPPRDAPGLTYSVEIRDGGRVAIVEETIRSLDLSAGRGFLRRFEIEPAAGAAVLLVDVVCPAGEAHEGGGIWSGPPSEHDWSLEAYGRSNVDVFKLDDGRFQFVAVSRPGGVRWFNDLLFIHLEEAPFKFEVATVITSRWSRERADSILEELSGR